MSSCDTNCDKYKMLNLLFGVIIIVLLIYICFIQIQDYQSQQDPMLEHLRKILIQIHPRVKDLTLYKADKSYTINKERVYLCLKDKNGEYYPLNMLIYVALHELAHVLNNKDVGHTEEFHRIFDELRYKASEIGVYNPSIPIIKDYSDH